MKPAAAIMIGFIIVCTAISTRQGIILHEEEMRQASKIFWDFKNNGPGH